MSPPAATPAQSPFYLLILQRMTWANANAFCAKSQMALATIATPEDNHAALALLGSSKTAWIGLMRSDDSAPFEWTDGEPFPNPTGFSAWAPGEPSTDAGADCVLAAGPGWSNVDCTTPNYFLCEKTSA